MVAVAFKPTVVMSQWVSANKAKKRLVLDLRYLNLHVWEDVYRVKFEDWKIFINYLTKEVAVFSNLTSSLAIIIWISTHMKLISALAGLSTDKQGTFSSLSYLMDFPPARISLLSILIMEYNFN